MDPGKRQFPAQAAGGTCSNRARCARYGSLVGHMPNHIFSITTELCACRILLSASAEWVNSVLCVTSLFDGSTFDLYLVANTCIYTFSTDDTICLNSLPHLSLQSVRVESRISSAKRGRLDEILYSFNRSARFSLRCDVSS